MDTDADLHAVEKRSTIDFIDDHYQQFEYLIQCKAAMELKVKRFPSDEGPSLQDLHENPHCGYSFSCLNKQLSQFIIISSMSRSSYSDNRFSSTAEEHERVDPLSD